MKQYPLAIEAISSDVDWTYFSRGHHNIRAFADALAKSGEVDGMTIKPEALCPEKMHRWFRRDVRNPRDGYTCWYHEVPEGTRRAFPVTMIEGENLMYTEVPE